jgi:phosphoadenosine phosphosulfate reductase
MPKGEGHNERHVLKCYSHFAPKMEWFEQFIKYEDDFDEKHSLGISDA